MKTLIFVVSFTLFALLQIGCASKGFNRGELKEQVGVVKPQYDDQEIKETFAKKANLPKPFKIGVYFKSPGRARGMDGDWRWTEQDKAQLEEIGKDLKSTGLVSEVFPIVGSVVTDESIKSLRLAAAKHHADALLIIGGAGQIDRYLNDWAWTYALLVPTLFVRGSVVDTLFITNATLWDVRNEYLYLTAEAEAITQNIYAAALGASDKVLLDQAKAESLKNLKGELMKMMKGTKL